MKRWALLFLLLVGLLIIIGCDEEKQKLPTPIKESPDVSQYNTASSENDIDLCDEIADPMLRNSCKAKITGDYSACLKIADYIEADYCILRIASSKGYSPQDIHICNNIKGESRKVECRAILFQEVTICDELNKYILNKRDCVHSVASSSGEITICDTYDFSQFQEPQDERDSCYSRHALRTKNKNACEKIVDDFRKRFCFKIFESGDSKVKG